MKAIVVGMKPSTRDEADRGRRVQTAKQCASESVRVRVRVTENGPKKPQILFHCLLKKNSYFFF